MSRALARLVDLLLLVPYALGYVAGALILVAVVVWLALRDGYAAGRRS
jgi:hypothetical protein